MQYIQEAIDEYTDDDTKLILSVITQIRYNKNRTKIYHKFDVFAEVSETQHNSRVFITKWYVVCMCGWKHQIMQMHNETV